MTCWNDSASAAGGSPRSGESSPRSSTATTCISRPTRCTRAPSERLPEIARATVYNTLGELVSLGEVIEVSTDGRAKRYDPNAHHPHQHLVCSQCGTIRDVHPTGDPLAGLPEAERFGFTISDADGHLPGHVPPVRRRLTAARPTPSTSRRPGERCGT